MKKYLLIIAIFTGLLVFAQKVSNKKNHTKQNQSFLGNFSVEQIAELQTKRQTIYLNLTEDQSKQIYELNLKIAQLRKEAFIENNFENFKDNKTLIFEHQSKKLNNVLKIKTELSKFLSEQQLEKWLEMHAKFNQSFSSKFNQTH